MMESQAGFIRQLVEQVRGRGQRRGPSRGRGAVRRRGAAPARRSVWGGCASWYRDEGGRITTNWPGTVKEYKQRTARVDPADFEVTRSG